MNQYDELFQYLLEVAKETTDEIVEVSVKVNVSHTAIRKSLKKLLSAHNDMMELVGSPVEFLDISVHSDKDDASKVTIKCYRVAKVRASFGFKIISDTDAGVKYQP